VKRSGQVNSSADKHLIRWDLATYQRETKKPLSDWEAADGTPRMKIKKSRKGSECRARGIPYRWKGEKFGKTRRKHSWGVRGKGKRSFLRLGGEGKKDVRYLGKEASARNSTNALKTRPVERMPEGWIRRGTCLPWRSRRNLGHEKIRGPRVRKARPKVFFLMGMLQEIAKEGMTRAHERDRRRQLLPRSKKRKNAALKLTTEQGVSKNETGQTGQEGSEYFRGKRKEGERLDRGLKGRGRNGEGERTGLFERGSWGDTVWVLSCRWGGGGIRC